MVFHGFPHVLHRFSRLLAGFFEAFELVARRLTLELPCVDLLVGVLDGLGLRLEVRGAVEPALGVQHALQAHAADDLVLADLGRL